MNRRMMIALTLIVLAGLACNLTRGLSQPVPSATPVPATVTALVPPTDLPATPTVALATATPAPVLEPEPTLAASLTPPVLPTATAGPTILSLPGANIAIPAGMATGADGGLQPGQFSGYYVPWGDAPPHLKFDLTDYALTDTFHQPVVFAYPIGTFPRYDPWAGQVIDRTRSIIGSEGAVPPLPLLPVFNAAQILSAKFKMLDFQNGQGFRYLTQYGQDAGPITSDNLFYTYQGITGDGQYYVAMILPVSAPVLPEDSTSPAPAGSAAIPDYNASDFAALYEAYINSVTDELQDLPDDQFYPTLDDLDALASSFLVTGLPDMIPTCAALLLPGMDAYVNPNPATQNRLRSGPSTSQDVIATLPSGAVMRLIGGPICADGLIFWNVEVAETGVTGWTAESDGVEQWLLPCLPDLPCPPD